ncbi:MULTISPECIES: non-ribosomal peptide synthetase [Priestia]|uniref:Carrier domain-containing protein n=1 Tax=Priestia veravalensis TaxID=1414648 RepID=A0A0V8JIF6_9BACI|nr:MULTISPECIES: non-ribosomal peptide synthetase [Priestia]KSU86850.1 hypothetical protein AS180_16335 [Priestia veravalensis]SCC46999.1 amino acid adenylation domain-containing protein [Priestia flexa]
MAVKNNIRKASLNEKMLWDHINNNRARYEGMNLFAAKVSADLNLTKLETSLYETLRTQFPFLLNKYELNAEEELIVLEEHNIHNFGIEILSNSIQKEQMFNYEYVPFLNDGFLFNVKAYQTLENEFVLLLNIHPLLGNKNTLITLVKQWMRKYLYNRVSSSLISIDMEEMYDYKFKNNIENTEKTFNYSFVLPYDNPKKKSEKSSISSLRFELDLKRIKELLNNSGIEDATLEETLLTVFSLLIHRYNTNKDESVSISLNNTNINNKYMHQVLNVNFDAQDTFISSVSKTSNGTYLNEDTLKNQPNYPIQFSYFNKSSSLADVGWTISFPTFTKGYYDLNLVFEQQEEKVLGILYYNEELFKKETVNRIIEQYKTLFYSCLVNDNLSILELDILPEREKNLILSRFNDTDYPFELETTLVTLFEEQVEKSPNSIALSYNNKKLTYGELNERSNQLAHYLIEKGIKKGSIVGVYFERSIEMVVSLYAVIKAGGAYLPLDPTHPKERVSFILEDANTSVVLTQNSIKQNLPRGSYEIICVDSEENLHTKSSDNLLNTVSPEDLAYVIYTSGSTGKPKGVLVQHQGIVNRLKWMQKEYNLKENDRVLQKTPYSFDVSVWEFFWPLQIGATLVIAKPEGHKDSIYLTEIIRKEQITVVHFVPSMLQLFLDFNGSQSCNSLRLVFCSGEALPFNLQQKFFELLNAELHNLYGPTEASVDVTYWKCVKNYERNIVPIGKPISNIKLYILDENLRPVPIGVPGELYISGIGLAKGYLNRSELNKERFIKNPYQSGSYSRLYKTGDLARYLEDGNIEYLGRLDFQVKIRGLRIELGEIEAMLCRHKDIKECLVSATKDKTGDDQLVAYLVTKEEIDLNQVKEFLKSKLPEYMIPLFFVVIEKFPLSPNGKIDRKQLPQPQVEQINSDREILLPTTDLEKAIYDIWSDVLGINDFSINDTFLSLGGHSLKAMQVITKLRNETNLELNISDMLVSKTVHKLSKFIENNLHKLQANSSSIKRLDSLEKPASLAQERMWFLTELNNDLSAYNITNVLRLSGAVNYDLIKKAIEKIVSRHESLRTTFYSKDGVLFHNVLDSIEFQVPTINLELEEKKEELVEELVIEESKHLFNIEAGPLFKAKLIKLSNDCHWLVLTFHHIIFDGWSESLFNNEFIKIYESYIENKPLILPKLDVNFSDYSSWQREELGKNHLKLQIKYWEEKLAGYTGNFELPTDIKRGKVQTFNGSQCRFKIPAGLVNDLKALGEREDATLYTTLLAAYKILLYRLTGINDTVIGSPVASRNNAQVENLIGYFVNTLVLRTNLSPGKSFIDTLKDVNNTTIEALAHQDIPFDNLVEIVSPERDISRNPLFQVAFALQNTHYNTNHIFSNDLLLDTQEVDTKISRFDLSLISKETEEGIECFFEYNTDLFYQSTIQKLVNYYLFLLEQILENPEKTIDSIPLVSSEEQNILLKAGQGAPAIYKEDKTAIELFEDVALRNHNKMAVKYYNNEINYKGLNERANQLAHYLIENNVKKGSKVGICLNRSLEFVVSVLAVMKAGAVYVPIDTNYPEERIKFILDDSQPDIILTEEFMNGMFSESGFNVMFLNDIQNKIKEYPTENIKSVNYEIEDLAYIIYTSGSTGTPKGVMVPHKGLCNVVISSIHEFKFNTETRMLQFSSMSFDASVWEIFMALLSGASLHISSPETYLNVIKKQKVTFAFLPPAVLSVLKLEDVPTLETIITGGEACPQNLVDKIGSKVNLYNAYGPTEASICTTIEKCKNDSKEPPIGTPIAGTQVYILDDSLNMVPFGYSGELYIGGLGVTKGYLNRPELDDKAFINNPFNKEEKIYKTGDIVRFRYDNKIEYLGRKDKQVKVRGLRIELGEIESVLNSLEEIEHSIVIPDENNQNLLGFVILNKALNKKDVSFKDILLNKLPRHMVPNNIYEINDIPVTTNGKIDRKALLACHFEKQMNNNYAIEMPRNELEEKIKKIWSSVLKIDQISINDNYFEIGGQSLSALQVISRIKEECQVDITLADFFSNSSISSLAKYIESKHGLEENDSTNIIIQIAPEGEDLKASPAQESLWLLQELNPSSITYNIPMVLELTGALDIESLRESIKTIVQRHQSLRTILFEREGHIFQEVTSGKNINLKVINSYVEKDLLEQEIREIINKEVDVPFNLKEGPLFRAVLYAVNKNKYYLVLVAHHIIFDGWSRTLLFNELASIYNSVKEGKEHTLVDPKYQYKDYTYSYNKKLDPSRISKSLDFYRDKMNGALHYVNIPKDRNYFKDNLSKKHVSFKINQSQITKMKNIISKSKSTTYMLLLAVTKALMYKLSNQKDIVIGTPIANRNDSTYESIIGYFVNTLAIRTDLSGEPTFMELLSRVKATFLETYEHNNIPYEKVVEVIKPERSGATSSLFNIMFNMLNLPDPEIKLNSLKTKVIEEYEIDSKFDLNFYVKENKEDIVVNIVYNNELFSQNRMLNLTKQFEIFLSQILDNPDINIDKYSLCSREEDRILPSPTIPLNYVEQDPVINLFKTRAKLVPNNIALDSSKTVMKYEQLDKLSNKVAHYLTTHGIVKGDYVALSGERSINFIVLLLGVIKTGAVFYVLNTNYPVKRNLQLIKALSPKILLHGSKLPIDLTQYLDVSTLQLTMSSIEDLNVDDSDIKTQICGRDNAYVLFTSGTTGEPKMIMNTHSPLTRFVKWHSENSKFNVNDNFSMLSGLSHDPVLRDIFTPIVNGATLHIPSEDEMLDPKRMREWFVTKEITVSHMTPQFGYILAEGENVPVVKSLKHIFFSGDILTVDLVNKLKKVAPNVICTNFYGATETPQAMSYETVSDTENHCEITLGKPINSEVQLLIMNNADQLCGFGEIGEICIRTPYLSSGYINDESLTNAKFISNPFTNNNEDIIYKTGDIGYYLTDGRIVFYGRKDNQVKVRGYRIELREIEAALKTHPQVKNAAVNLFRDNQISESLVAYINFELDSKDNIENLRCYLNDLLPSYMVPKVFIEVQKIPLTPNGKVDWSQLADPLDYLNKLKIELEEVEMTEAEEKMKLLWEELLNTPVNSVNDNFFNLGGHSLLVTRLMSRIEEVFEVRLSLRYIFENPTIKDIVNEINRIELEKEEELEKELRELLGDTDNLEQILGELERDS